MRETEKFRTERLVVRPWQIDDLPLAMELWGIPPSRRSLIPAANSPRPKSERSSAPRSIGRGPVAFNIGRCSITAMASSSAAAGFGRGSRRPARRISKSVPSREALLGQGLRNGSSVRRARIRLGKIATVASLRWASPAQSCFGENPEKARIRVHRKCVLRTNRLDASVLRLQSAAPETEHFHIAIARNSS